MTCTSRPVSKDSLSESPSPFCVYQDKEPNPFLAEYRQPCSRELYEVMDARAAEQVYVIKQSMGSAAEAFADAAT